MNYDNYYKKGGMTQEDLVSSIALRIGARKPAVAEFVEKNKIDADALNSDLKSGKVYFMDVITAIVGKPDNKYEKEIIKKYGSKMAHGGKTQGYDDREDERLSMEYGKIHDKDFVGSHEMREHSRRDDARFEERMEKGGKLYTTMMNVGKAKYVINYHDGNKTHKDGSPFYDINIFSNRKDFDKAVKKLESEGYKYRYADGGYMADGGETQGYDDREDERLSMEYGKIHDKDFVGSHEMREHSRRDDARFEERMAGGMMANGGSVNRTELNKKIKDWYLKTYPTDDLGEDINDDITFKSFYAYLSQGYDAYDVLEVYDSLVRERVFEKLSEIYNVNYDVIYDMWMNNNKNEGRFAYRPYGKTKGRFKLIYKIEGAEQSEKKTSLEEAITNAKRYASPKLGYTDIHIYDENGKEYFFEEGGYMADGGEIMSLEEFKKTLPDVISPYYGENDIIYKAKWNPFANKIQYFKNGRRVGKPISVEYAYKESYLHFANKNTKTPIRDYIKFAKGGYMADGGETGRDKNGMLYALMEHVSSGEIANLTDTSKYSDIDEIRSKAIKYYMDNGDKPYSYAELISVLKKVNHNKYGKGGYTGWDMRDGEVTLNGKLVTRYDFDSDADAFFIDSVTGSGQKGFGQKEQVYEYLTENLNLSKFAKGGYTGWDMRDGEVTLNGKLVTRYDFDSDADAFFIDSVTGSGQKGFGQKEQVYQYLTENLNLSKFAKGGDVIDNSKNDWKYTDVDDIEYVIVKDKNGKELRFAGKYVLSGVHDLLAKGGKLSDEGKYYSKNNVVAVVSGGKNIIDKNTVSGVWIMKNAKPMDEDVLGMKIGKTTIKKGHYGWVGKTMIDNFKGYDWDITTIKNSNGDLVTTAQGGKNKKEDGYSSFSFMMFQDPNIRLKSSRPARVTDKVVTEQHEQAIQYFKDNADLISEHVDKIQAKKKMADGGAIGFDALAKKVAKNYEGDKVKKEYQNQYGKTYDKEEAEEVGKKVAAKVYRQQQAKMKKGGKVRRKNPTSSNNKMTRIARKASEIRMANESWRDAYNRAKSMVD